MVQPVDFGVAELVTDPQRPSGTTLLIDGVPQSYVDLDDPTYLPFDYTRRIASVIDAGAAPGSPLRVVHLGGGAFTLPRYIAATRPDSVQVVVERDAALVALLGRTLPLPRGADVRINIGDARAAIEAAAQENVRFDLVIADVYSGAQMPASVATPSFAAGIARLLNPDGLYAANVTDLPPLAFSRVQAATLRVAFADVCVIAGRDLLRGRRYGNLVLAAARTPPRLPVERLLRSALRDPVPGTVLHGASFARFVTGTRPATEEPQGPRAG